MDPTELFTQEWGAGFPLVLLHGNGESSDYFHNQIVAFSAHYRVIAVDTRGHGKSPRGTQPFTLSQFAADLKALLDARGIQKTHLLGFSDGANIALLFSLSYPQYVEKLILNGGNLTPGGVKLSEQLPIVVRYALVSIAAPFDAKALKQKELLGLMVNEPHIRTGRLAALTMPALVIAGDNDMIRDKHSRLIADSLRNGTFKRLHGDHFIAEKQPEQFNAAVLDFLADRTGTDD